jgi:hypothetical protein
LAYLRRITDGSGSLLKPDPSRARPTARVTSSTRGVAADVEDAGERRAVGDDDARLEERGRQHHAHRMDRREPAEREALVLDAVLGAHDRQVGRRDRRQLGQRRLRVLGLHGQHDDIVVTEGELGGVLRHREPHHLVPVGRSHPQAVGGDGGPVRAPCDEGHVVAVACEVAGDRPTDGAGSVDDEAHTAASHSRTGGPP